MRILVRWPVLGGVVQWSSLLARNPAGLRYTQACFFLFRRHRLRRDWRVGDALCKTRLPAPVSPYPLFSSAGFSTCNFVTHQYALPTPSTALTLTHVLTSPPMQSYRSRHRTGFSLVIVTILDTLSSHHHHPAPTPSRCFRALFLVPQLSPPFSASRTCCVRFSSFSCSPSPPSLLTPPLPEPRVLRPSFHLLCEG